MGAGGAYGREPAGAQPPRGGAFLFFLGFEVWPSSYPQAGLPQNSPFWFRF
jgi:hypothetical protein